MSDELKDELISDSVADAVESIAEQIVEAAIAEAVEDKIEELSAPVAEPEAEPVVENAVLSVEPEVVLEPAPFLGTAANGAIASMSADKKKTAKKKVARAEDKSYLISERSLFISGVGRLWKGFNVVPAKYESKWLSLSGVRKATQTEIDKEYGR